MARRAIWKGVISFADIRVPVKLYAAVERREVDFHLLHAADMVRLRQQLVCEREDAPVPGDEVVKGLEVEDGRYVLLDDDDLAELEPETDRTIHVDRFCPAQQLDPRLYDRPYHLGPDGEARKYAALARALENADTPGLCRWTFRKRSYNGVLRAVDGVLELTTLRLGAEVAPTDALHLETPGLSDKERTTAAYLVQELSEDFDPSRYRDDFHQRLMELVRTKAEQGAVKTRAAPRPEPTGSDELLASLKASLERIKERAAREENSS
jgi:DNA end-binding protein Ku